MTMGCYGIGVSRIVAAAVEQNYDDSGIIWPASISPFHVAIAPINAHKSTRVRELAEDLYRRCRDAGIDALLCDSKERPGVMFANLDLIGIPHRLVLSDRGLDAGTLEYKGRTDTETTDIAIDTALRFVQDKLSANGAL
jgi:prolyl-tRNA synthetase